MNNFRCVHKVKEYGHIQNIMIRYLKFLRVQNFPYWANPGFINRYFVPTAGSFNSADLMLLSGSAFEKPRQDVFKIKFSHTWTLAGQIQWALEVIIACAPDQTGAHPARRPIKRSISSPKGFRGAIDLNTSGRSFVNLHYSCAPRYPYICMKVFRARFFPFAKHHSSMHLLLHFSPHFHIHFSHISPFFEIGVHCFFFLAISLFFSNAYIPRLYFKILCFRISSIWIFITLNFEECIEEWCLAKEGKRVLNNFMQM